LSQHQVEEEVVTKEKNETDEPERFKVIFHNDDYTTMEFVVRVLKKIYRKSSAEATEVMLRVHQTGTGVAGIYAKQIAETKVEQTLKLAREEGHPLMVTMEPEDD
jgi:ATP-dependent Clp protease adaptor protein ClpS